MFRLGEKVEGYLENGEAFKGRIISFGGNPKLVRVETVIGSKEFAKVDTLISVPVTEFKVSRDTLIAQIRNSAEGAFKSDKDARDYLLRLLKNLECFTD